MGLRDYLYATRVRRGIVLVTVTVASVDAAAKAVELLDKVRARVSGVVVWGLGGFVGDLLGGW